MKVGGAGAPSDRQVNRIISHTRPVSEKVSEAADRIERVAKENLERHHKTGSHTISHSHGSVDHFVSLVGPGALALEFGHRFDKNGHIVGEATETRILRDAIGGV